MLNITALKIRLEKGKTATNKYAIGVSIVVILQVYIAVLLTEYIAENPAVIETLEKAGFKPEMAEVTMKPSTETELHPTNTPLPAQ